MASNRKVKQEDEEEEDEEEEADEEEESGKKRPRTKAQPVNLAEPLFFWIVILALALFARFVTTYTSAFSHTGEIYSFLTSASNFFLLSSGALILPLIVGTVIGSEIGLKASNLAGALKAGLLNGIYTAIVYVIAIIIIYEIMLYALPNPEITTTFLINGLIVPQVVTVLILIEIFAILSHGRKVS
jgi:hypothetical protein